jgi:dienelactone hydrolase
MRAKAGCLTGGLPFPCFKRDTKGFDRGAQAHPGKPNLLTSRIKISPRRFCAGTIFALLFVVATFRATVVCAQQSSSNSATAGPRGSSKDLPPNYNYDHETWDSVVLDPGSLIAEKPLRGELDEFPDFTRELVQVHWRFADPIELYVIRPKGVENPPVVLYLYGYPSETDRFKDDGYCRRVTQGGFAAIGFVSALTGQRYHDRPMKQWFVSELQEALVTSTHDVQMILNYLADCGDFDMRHVGMVGAGSGATIAILAASVDSRIQALDLLDPWGDWTDWMAYSPRIPDAERPNYLKAEFLKRIAPFDPIAWLPKLKTNPVRLELVADDPVTPSPCQKKIEAAAAHDSVEVVKFQSTRALLDASSGGKHFQWIKDRLQPAAQQKAAE